MKSYTLKNLAAVRDCLIKDSLDQENDIVLLVCKMAKTDNESEIALLLSKIAKKRILLQLNKELIQSIEGFL